MNISKVLGIALVAVTAAAAGAWGGARWLSAPTSSASQRSSAATSDAVPRSATAVSVALADARRIPFARGVNAVGSLRSDESVVVRPEVAGRIQRLAFDEGTMVRAGQVLVVLDDAVPRAELAQARANLALAQSQYRRSASLQQQGFVSQQARDEVGSSLQAQQANAALAQARLDKMTIRAPFDGMVGLRAVSVGDYVNAGQDIAPLVAVDPLKVDFRVPEMYLPRLAVGQGLSLRVDALGGAERTGKVYAVSPVVDAGGRSVLLRATVGNADGQLRAGMFVRVQLVFSSEPALLVPEAALAPSGETQYVFRVVDGVAHRVQVNIGERRDGQVEIVKGLADGDRVVVSGLQRVIDGGPVEPLAPGV